MVLTVCVSLALLDLGMTNERNEYDKQALNKFAELIVRECAWAADFADKAPGEYILKRFGVEE